MENANIKDRVHTFIKDYAEKIFYFCLKKTGNHYAAEDLASDILLNVILALEKGVVPVHFPAWVWRIARNRYSVWADKKHKHSQWKSFDDVFELDLDKLPSVPEDELIQKEQ